MLGAMRDQFIAILVRQKDLSGVGALGGPERLLLRQHARELRLRVLP